MARAHHMVISDEDRWKSIMSEGPGNPQGPTTGRWELYEAARGKDVTKGRRWNEVPIWYRVLDRFGLPTLMVIGLSWAGWRIANKVVDKMDAALTAQVTATANLVASVEEMKDDTHVALTILLDRLGEKPPNGVMNTGRPKKPPEKKVPNAAP